MDKKNGIVKICSVCVIRNQSEHNINIYQDLVYNTFRLIFKEEQS